MLFVLSSSCSSETPSNDADAATDGGQGGGAGGSGGTTGATGGAAGASGGTAGGGGGAGGTAGASGGFGGASGAGGTAGTTGGRAGASDAGGRAGASGAGQAGTAGGDRDASPDRTDGNLDGSTPDRDADAPIDRTLDGPGPSQDADATSDDGTPPSDAAACSPLPTSGVYATFRVVSDVFRASITNTTGIDQALALWQGQSQAKIPVGQLECGNGAYNCGWSWSMSPSTITFAELTIEVCDATPSYVQGNCSSFPNGRYCPWSAELIELRDCRTQATCPLVPR